MISITELSKQVEALKLQNKPVDYSALPQFEPVYARYEDDENTPRPNLSIPATKPKNAVRFTASTIEKDNKKEQENLQSKQNAGKKLSKMASLSSATTAAAPVTKTGALPIESASINQNTDSDLKKAEVLYDHIRSHPNFTFYKKYDEILGIASCQHASEKRQATKERIQSICLDAVKHKGTLGMRRGTDQLVNDVIKLIEKVQCLLPKGFWSAPNTPVQKVRTTLG